MLLDAAVGRWGPLVQAGGGERTDGVVGAGVGQVLRIPAGVTGHVQCLDARGVRPGGCVGDPNPIDRRRRRRSRAATSAVCSARCCWWRSRWW
ncbi:hypothetical protein AB5I41_23650 [Sphingomonas sp. MMS24-JH45]